MTHTTNGLNGVIVNASGNLQDNFATEAADLVPNHDVFSMMLLRNVGRVNVLRERIVK